jgi:CSLREA domain-containing protein
LGISGAHSAPLASLDGSISIVAQPNPDVGNTVDLTSAGTADWAIWGTGSSTSLSPDQRKSGAAQISSLTDIPHAGAPLRGLGQFTPGSVPPSPHPFAFSWTDGAPTASGTQVRAGIQHDGQPLTGANGAGFSFTVPADETTRTLKVWVALNQASGQLTASLSDDSAADYAQSYGTSGADNFLGAVYTIDYAADSPGETLTVTWVETASFCGSGCDNVSLHAVALEGPGGGGGTSYTVNSTNDVNDGTCDATHCSLREAINASNADSGDSTIDFGVSGEIVLDAVLPAITDTISIDGSTGSENISIDSSGIGNAGTVFTLDDGSDGSTIENTSIDGGSAGTGGIGFTVLSDGNTIRRNDISGTSGGVVLMGGAANNTVGGSFGIGEQNRIWDFDEAGVLLDGAGSGNKVQGNFVGQSPGGAPAGGHNGIVVRSTPAAVIGAQAGPDQGGNTSLSIFGNVVGDSQVNGGPSGNGIVVEGAGSTGTIVAFNFVGIGRGSEDLGNADAGILVSGSSGNQLGPANVVANNGSSLTGIHIESGSANRIVANSIFDNGGKGIAVDEGANGDLASPTLVNAVPIAGGNATVSGSISGPTGSYFVEFFKNDECDATPGGGEGRTYAGFANVTITEIGSTFSSPTFGATIGEGDVITATVTGSSASTNNTSEFSNCVTVTAGAGTTPPPVLNGAVPFADGATLGVAGVWDAGFDPDGTVDFNVQFYSVPTCTAAAPKTPLGTATNLETNGNGIGAFAIDHLTNVAVGTLVVATVTEDAAPSVMSNCVVADRFNTSWPTALQTTGAETGHLRSSGQARWFKVPIDPNSRLDVRLTGLPADYDLVVFKDIDKKYKELTGTAPSPEAGPNLALNDLNRDGANAPVDLFNTSQYNRSAWDPTNWKPDLNANVFTPQFSPTEYSPTEYSASFTSPTEYSPTEYSPTEYSPTEYSPTEYSPTEYSADQFSRDAWASFNPADPRAFTSAQTASLLAVSATPGTGDETVSVNTWNNTGNFYIRVQGKNGSFNATQPFSLQVTREPTSCTGVSSQLLDNAAPFPPNRGNQTLILWDATANRWPAGTNLTTIGSKLTQLAGATGGVVVNVGADAVVAGLNSQADGATGCPYAKNLVAARIKQIVAAHRSTNLKYVVVVGGDNVIPFYRSPDPALLGNETLYVPPVLDTSSSQASLRLGYVLTDDFLASNDQVSLHGNDFPVADLAIGRLVETTSDITGVIDAFLANNSVTPSSSLATGYGFLTDTADQVAGRFDAIVPPANSDELITNANVSPGTASDGANNPDSYYRTRSWTATDLRRELLGQRHDLVFLAGHFSANDALSADYRTNILTTELPNATPNMANTIVFSAGCHAGYNLVNEHSATGGQPLDWAQAFAQKRATLIAGTGYQYGDTDFIAHSERLYVNLAQELGGAIGSSLLRSKQRFLEATPGLSALDEKAVLEATLFGLPMLRVNVTAGTPGGETPAVSPTPVTGGPGSELGLRSGSLTVAGPAGSGSSKTLNGLATPATWFTGTDGLALKPMQPVLPLESANVTVPGQSVRGALFLGGSYQDTPNTTPLTAAPATELRGIHAAFQTDVFFPPQPWSLNYFGALSGSGNTQLHVTPVQHKSESPTMTRRKFTGMNFQVFYSNNTASYCGDRGALAPCGPGQIASTPALSAPPTITGVDATVSGTTLTFMAHVIGDNVAGIQSVWATYTTPPGAGGGTGTWTSIQLEQDVDDPTLFTKAVTVPTPAAVDFMIQAVSGVGKVTLDSNFGAFYRIGSIPGPPEPGQPPPIATTLAFVQGPPSSVAFKQSFQVKVKLTSSAGCSVSGKTVQIGLGTGGDLPAITNASGEATITMSAALTPATYPLVASFAGTSTCAASDVSANVTVTKQATSLALAFPFVTLTASTSPPAPLPERTVIVTVLQGATVKLTHVGRTDPQGRVLIPPSLLATLAQGGYTIRAEYAGETGYLGSTVTGSPLNVIRRGSGSDTITGTQGDDLIIDAGGTNTINALGGNDTIIAGDGTDTINGGDGNDTIDAGNGSNVVNGGNGNDLITTGSGTDTIDGGSGNDTINAGNGTNNVKGGDGNDLITTGTGNDSIDGGPGFDFCSPGTGSNSVKNCEG